MIISIILLVLKLSVKLGTIIMKKTFKYIAYNVIHTTLNLTIKAGEMSKNYVVSWDPANINKASDTADDDLEISTRKVTDPKEAEELERMFGKK